MSGLFVKVAAPIWLVLYFIVIYVFGAPLFIYFILLFGLWNAVLLHISLFVLWSFVFYLILLQSNSFERLRDIVRNFLKNRHGKLFDWLGKKYFTENTTSYVSPAIIILVFLIQSPLIWVPLIRYSFPKNVYWKGLLWIVLGSVIKITTWYLPVYGLGFSIIRSLVFR